MRRLTQGFRARQAGAPETGSRRGEAWIRGAARPGFEVQRGRGSYPADVVTDPDHAAEHDVRAWTTAMHETAKHAGRGEALRVRAGLTQALPKATDVADEEPLPDERVQVDAARDHVAPRLLEFEVTGGERDLIERLS